MRKSPRVKRAGYLIEHLETLDAADLRQRLMAAIEREERGGATLADGYGHGQRDGGSGRGDGSGGGSTLAAVVEREAPLIDPVAVLTAGALADLERAVDALASLGNRLDRIDRHCTDPRPKAERGLAVCAESPCPDYAEPGKRGRCKACYDWGWRWQQAHPGDGPPPPVPADVIDERQLRRIRL